MSAAEDIGRILQVDEYELRFAMAEPANTNLIMGRMANPDAPAEGVAAVQGLHTTFEEMGRGLPFSTDAERAAAAALAGRFLTALCGENVRVTVEPQTSEGRPNGL